MKSHSTRPLSVFDLSVFKPHEERSSYSNCLEFVQKTFMPNPVKGFTFIAKESMDFFAFIKSFTKCIIDIYKLIECRITRNETRLTRMLIRHDYDENLKYSYVQVFLIPFLLCLKK